MSDNITVSPGSGATVRMDDVGGVLYQVIKLDVGGDGASSLVSSHVPVKRTAGTATLSNVASSASSVTLLASNSNRLGAMIYNDSTQAVYVKFGATASSTSFTVKLAADSYYELPSPVFTGQIDAIWVSANGNARVTELT